KFTGEAGLPDLAGKYVFDANPDIVALLREKGMLIAEQVYQHSYPYCWRSKTPIIFRAVEQFFIRIDALRSDALAAIKSVSSIPAFRITPSSAQIPSCAIRPTCIWKRPTSTEAGSSRHS